MRHPILEVHASDAANCLAQFHAKLVDGLDEAGDPAKVGTVMHRVAENLVIAKSERAMIDVYEVARQTIRTEATRLALSPSAIVDALEILEKILAPDSRISLWPGMGWNGKPEYKWGLRDVDGVFEFVENPTEADGEMYAAGTADLVEWKGGVVRIRDWKSSRQMLSADDAWESFQARLYAYAFLRRFPDAPSIEFSYGLLRHGYYTTPVDFIRGDPWEWGVEARLRATREQREKALASGEWPATRGPWCAYCPVRWKCSEFLRGVEMGDEVPSDWPPEEVARALGATKIAVRDLDRKARSIVEETGRPIILDRVTGEALGYKPTNGCETVLSYEETMDRLREFGMTQAQYEEHFRFVQSNHYPGRVKKVLREVLEVDKETAESLVVPVSKTEFTVHTPDVREQVSEGQVSIDDLDRLIDQMGA